MAVMEDVPAANEVDAIAAAIKPPTSNTDFLFDFIVLAFVVTRVE